MKLLFENPLKKKKEKEELLYLETDKSIEHANPPD